MEKIRLRDIDFSKLEKLSEQGTQSTVYRDHNTCIKMLDKATLQEKKEIYGKLQDMDGIKIDDVLFPKQFILEGERLEGYTMDYIEKSQSLFDYCFSTRHINAKDILKAIKSTSLILRKLHAEEILYPDLSLDNILISRDGRIKFCDIDGCSYGKYISNATSTLLIRFIVEYKNAKEIILSRNTDRIALMLFFYLIMYQEEIQKVSERQYRKLSRHIKTLENTMECAKILIDKKVVQPIVPYMDELIDDRDDYIIDRMKQKRKRG